MDKDDLALRKARLAIITADPAAHDIHVSALPAGMRSLISQIAREETRVPMPDWIWPITRSSPPPTAPRARSACVPLAHHVGNERWTSPVAPKPARPGRGQPDDITVDARPGLQLRGGIASFLPAISSR